MPRVLRGIPGQLLALGVVHIANVVEGPRLPNLWAAAGYEGMLYSPPENSPQSTLAGVVQSPGLLGPCGRANPVLPPTPSILCQLGSLLCLLMFEVKSPSRNGKGRTHKGPTTHLVPLLLGNVQVSLAADNGLIEPA